MNALSIPTGLAESVSPCTPAKTPSTPRWIKEFKPHPRPWMTHSVNFKDEPELKSKVTKIIFQVPTGSTCQTGTFLQKIKFIWTMHFSQILNRAPRKQRCKPGNKPLIYIMKSEYHTAIGQLMHTLLSKANSRNPLAVLHPNRGSKTCKERSP